MTPIRRFYALSAIGATSTFNAASDKDQHVQAVLQAVYHLIREEIDRQVSENLKTFSVVEESRVGEIAAQVILRRYSDLQSADSIPNVPGDFGKLFQEAYGAGLHELIDSVFEKLPLAPAARNQLAEIAPLCFQKKLVKSGSRSGVVIAGFGEDEVYPRLRSFEVDGIVCGFLRLTPGPTFDISSAQNAVIVPFAQSDVISAFMEGLDPALKTLLSEMLMATFTNLPDAILSSLPGGVLDQEQQTRLREAVGKTGEPMLHRIQQFVREHHVKPIISAVGVLPKDELAAMAEDQT